MEQTWWPCHGIQIELGILLSSLAGQCMSNPTNESTSATGIHSLYVIGRLESRMVSQWRFLPFSMLTPADSTLFTETVPLCFAIGTRFRTISQIASHDTSYTYRHQGEHDGRRGQITMRSDLRFTACITYPIYQRKDVTVTMWGSSRGILPIQKYTRLSTTVTSSIFFYNSFNSCDSTHILYY